MASKRESPAKQWVFTLNNYTEEEYNNCCNVLKEMKYAIVGKEIGSSGTPHLQGFFILNTKLRLSGLKKLFNNDRYHFDRSNCKDGTKSSDYCKKGQQSHEEWTQHGNKGPNFGKDAVYFEHGTLGGNEGKRSDLLKAKDKLDAGYSLADVAKDEETFPVYLKYSNALKEYAAMIQPILPHCIEELRPWQKELQDYLQQPPSSTKIKFIVDFKGGNGKTEFAKYWMSKYPNETQILSPGKKQDMAMMVNVSVKYLFINCTREQTDLLNYSFLESVKDRIVASPKFHSVMKFLLHTVHLVVMMNEHPNRNALSQHRYDVTILKDDRVEKHIADSVAHSIRTSRDLGVKYTFPPPGFRETKRKRSSTKLPPSSLKNTP